MFNVNSNIFEYFVFIATLSLFVSAIIKLFTMFKSWKRKRREEKDKGIINISKKEQKKDTLEEFMTQSAKTCREKEKQKYISKAYEIQKILKNFDYLKAIVSKCSENEEYGFTVYDQINDAYFIRFSFDYCKIYQEKIVRRIELRIYLPNLETPYGIPIEKIDSEDLQMIDTWLSSQFRLSKENA